MTENKTIVGKILQAVFDLFKSNWQSFAKKLFNKIPDDVKEKITIGILVVENVKTWLGGDTAKFITHIIPGDLDEEIRLKLIEVCKTVLDISEDTTGIGKFELKYPLQHALASDINKHLTGLSFGQSALTTEVVYQNLKDTL